MASNYNHNSDPAISRSQSQPQLHAQKQHAVMNHLPAESQFESEYDTMNQSSRVLTPVSRPSVGRRGSLVSTEWTPVDTPLMEHASSVTPFHAVEPAPPAIYLDRSDDLFFGMDAVFNSTWEPSKMYNNNIINNNNNNNNMFTNTSHGMSLPFATAPAWPPIAYPSNPHMSQPASVDAFEMATLPSSNMNFTAYTNNNGFGVASQNYRPVNNNATRSFSSPQYVEPASLAISPFRTASSSPFSGYQTPRAVSSRVSQPGPWSGLQQRLFNSVSRTVAPSQTLMNVRAMSQSVPDLSQSMPELSFANPQTPAKKAPALLRTSSYQYPGSLATKKIKTEAEPSSSPFSTPLRKISHGNRALKKSKIAHSASKKREDKYKEGLSYKGKPLLVKSLDAPANKTHGCEFYLEDEKRVCGKMFQRVEHLKRHRQTHDGDVYFYCPDPECKKFGNYGRRFKCRNDNLREHMKTHVKDTTTKRNSSRTYEQFFAYIRADFPSEDAQKYIDYLTNWRQTQEAKKLAQQTSEVPADVVKVEG